MKTPIRINILDNPGERAGQLKSKNGRRHAAIRMLRLSFIVLLIVSACTLATGWEALLGAKYSSTGEQIYFSGIGGDGLPINYSGGPFFGMMRGQQLSCASCHGVDGRGGELLAHMRVVRAPNITFTSQIGEQLDDSGDIEGHAHGEEGYNLDDFRQAVVFGRHPDGAPLDSDMPRWQMEDSDLAELFAFLQTLP